MNETINPKTKVFHRLYEIEDYIEILKDKARVAHCRLAANNYNLQIAAMKIELNNLKQNLQK